MNQWPAVRRAGDYRRTGTARCRNARSGGTQTLDPILGERFPARVGLLDTIFGMRGVFSQAVVPATRAWTRNGSGAIRDALHDLVSVSPAGGHRVEKEANFESKVLKQPTRR
jgi:hypothetical protein